MRYQFRYDPPGSSRKKENTDALLANWSSRWQQLTVAARRCFLDLARGNRLPLTGNHRGQLASRFPAPALEELHQAGFVVFREPGTPGVKNRQVGLSEVAVDFAERLQAIELVHPLAAADAQRIDSYFYRQFTTDDLYPLLSHVLEASGLPQVYRSLSADQLVTRSPWLGWVVKALADPLAQPVLDAVEQADGRLSLAKLIRAWPERERSAIAETVERLVRHLALFEDLQPRSLELEVGLLPAVLAGLRRSREHRERPALAAAPPPVEVGPAEGVLLGDMRSFLLELVSAPARLKQGSWALFQKETGRFEACLVPLAAFYRTTLSMTAAGRRANALHWAQYMGLVQRGQRGGAAWLELNSAGQHWLALPLNGQATFLYDRLRQPTKEMDPYQLYATDDYLFLGSHVAALESKRGQQDYYPEIIKPAQREPLREALYRTFQELPVGVFYRRDQFLAHALFGPSNPLLLGREASRVMVFSRSRIVPPLEEALVDAGQELLNEVLDNRLIPLGGVQVGVAADGALLLARQPRLDAYFGHQAAETEEPPAVTSRVVVQPDFSVIVIGLDPAPAVELAPFCERKAGRAEQGALQFKLTRDAVVRAVTTGLTGDEIVGRLQRLSSTPLPANVLHEVREWCSWVRQVRLEPVSLFRCPDAATADRLVAALGKRAERVSQTAVALPAEGLSTAERNRLRAQGLLVEGEPAVKARASKGKRKRRSW